MDSGQCENAAIVFDVKMNIKKVISANGCQLTKRVDIASFADIDDALEHLPTLAYWLLASTFRGHRGDLRSAECSVPK